MRWFKRKEILALYFLAHWSVRSRVLGSAGALELASLGDGSLRYLSYSAVFSTIEIPPIS